MDPDFNPTNWKKVEHDFFIYADDHGFEFAEVDEEDYLHFVKWKWHVNQPHAKRNGKKRYLRRSRGGGGAYLPPLYLHVEIMKRTGIEPPDEHHLVVDHIDGNEFNCKRFNLRWATFSMNNTNRRRVR